MLLIILFAAQGFGQVADPAQELHTYKVTVATTINNNVQGLARNSFNAEVLLDIGKSGMPDDIKIVKSTGDSRLDDNLVEKIKELCPFDELPASYLSDSLKFIVLVGKRTGQNNFSYLPPNYYNKPLPPTAQNTYSYSPTPSTMAQNIFNSQQYQYGQPSYQGSYIRSIIQNQVNYWIHRKLPGVPYFNMF